MAKHQKPPYRILLVDTETGEELHELPLGYVPCPKHETLYGHSFMLANLEAVLHLAKDRELRGRPTQVFLGIIGTIDYDNWVRLSTGEIAKLLELHPADVSRSFKLLADKGVLVRGKKVGSTYLYRLNPWYGYRGKQAKAKKLHLELVQASSLREETTA